MAVCKKCGKSYLSKECPECNSSTPFKKIKTDKNNKIKYAAISIFSILIIVTVYKYINSNPLIGKWKPAQKYSIFGNMPIEFKDDKVKMMGIVAKAEYEIDGDEISVTDQTGSGMIYHMIDKDHMYIEMLGKKIIYEKVK